MPLLPVHVFVRASSHTKMILRGCYMVLMVAVAITNLALVLLWRPVDRCRWDIDISWSTPLAIHSTSSPCHTASLAAWVIAASLRVIVTIIVTVSLTSKGAFIIDKHSFSCYTSTSSERILWQGILQNIPDRCTTLHLWPRMMGRIRLYPPSFRQHQGRASTSYSPQPRSDGLSPR